MSIEKLIEDNTAALKELALAIKAFELVTGSISETDTSNTVSSYYKEKPKNKKQVQDLVPPPDGAPLTLDEVTKAFQNVIKTNGRAAAVGLLKKYKGEKLSDVQVGDYANFVEDAELLTKAKG